MMADVVTIPIFEAKYTCWCRSTTITKEQLHVDLFKYSGECATPLLKLISGHIVHF